MEAPIGIVPTPLLLAEKEQLPVKVFRKRAVTPANSGATANPTETSVITFDVSTPLTFTDLDNSYLMWDIQFINNFACVDYNSFPIDGCGGACIQKLEIFNAGNSLELLDQYALITQTITDSESENNVELHMYFSSQLKNGMVKECHKNFIKPPMVSADGNIMFGPNPLGLGFQSDAAISSIYLNMKAALKMDPYQGSASSINFPSMTYVGGSGVNVIQLTESKDNADFANSTAYGAFPVINTYPSSGPTPPTMGALAAAPFSTRPPLRNPTPMDWPDLFDPSLISIVGKFVNEMGTVNSLKVNSNLNSVKFFPIGMYPTTNSYGDKPIGTLSAGWDSTTVTSTVANTFGNSGTNTSFAQPSYTTYRVCYRPRSGIIGREADKMLVNNLIQSQQMQLKITWAQPYLAMQISSDPLRRIVGTVRDYSRNVGTANGKRWLAQTFTTQDISGWNTAANDSNHNRYVGNLYLPTASTYAPGYGPIHGGQQKGTATDASYLSAINGIFTQSAASGRMLINGVNDGVFTIQGNIGPLSFLPPMPQYCLTYYPYVYNAINSSDGTTPITRYAVDTECFYGCKDEFSQPQCRRILDFPQNGTPNTGGVAGFNINGPNAVSGGTKQGSTITGLTYQIQNLVWVSDVLTVPPEVNKHIMHSAGLGKFIVTTTTYTATSIPGVQAAASQSLVVPVRGNAVQKLFFVFRDQDQTSNTTGWFYNSNSCINPFALVTPAPSSVYVNYAGFTTDANGNAVATNLYGVGVDKKPIFQPMVVNPADANYSVQLQIAQVYYPQNPLTSAEEMVIEWAKSMGSVNSKYFYPSVDSSIITYFPNGDITAAPKIAYNPFENGKFGTAFIPYCLLDDQTIMGNADWAPLYSNSGPANTNPFGDADGVYGANALTTAASNGYNFICPRGYTVPCYTPPESRFKLVFNFMSFPQEMLDGYLYMGTNTITLVINGAVGLTGNDLNGKQRVYELWAIAQQRATLTYGIGGSMVFIK